jgi:hypothetical protein
MKKRSLFIFFILILSVLFSYQTAHASMLTGTNFISVAQPNNMTTCQLPFDQNYVGDMAWVVSTASQYPDPTQWQLSSDTSSNWSTELGYIGVSGNNLNVQSVAQGYDEWLCNQQFNIHSNFSNAYYQLTYFNPLTNFYFLSVRWDGTHEWLGVSDLYHLDTDNTTLIRNGDTFTPPNTATRFQDILPADDSTTSSTIVVASANYYLASPDTGNYSSPPTEIKMFLHRTDTTGTADQDYVLDSPTYNALTAISHTFTLPTASTWELRFDLSGDGYYFVSPLGTPTTFHVVSDPAVGTSGYTTCSITDIAGCFQNALIFLFYPSSASVDQFNGLYNQFINKPPFGYIVAIQNALKGINDTATSAFTLQSLPILNTYLFDPIRLALAWVLWVAFAFVLYHRLKNIAI